MLLTVQLTSAVVIVIERHTNKLAECIKSVSRPNRTIELLLCARDAAVCRPRRTASEMWDARTVIVCVAFGPDYRSGTVREIVA